MVQNKKWVTVCPECGREQNYRPRKSYSELKNSRRKKCIYCGRSYKVKDRIKGKQGIESREEKSDKPEGFFKYSKSEGGE